MRYAIPLTAFLALAACANTDPAAVQAKINGGLGLVASAYKCYRQIDGAIAAVPKDIAAQSTLAAGVALSDADCQAAIKNGTVFVVVAGK